MNLLDLINSIGREKKKKDVLAEVKKGVEKSLALSNAWDFYKIIHLFLITVLLEDDSIPAYGTTYMMHYSGGENIVPRNMMEWPSH